MLRGRAARRAWASEVNRVARLTSDMAAAREAGAELAMVAIDCCTPRSPRDSGA
jgi:hypothetical protein